MTKALIRIFIKHSDEVTNPGVREAYGRLAGWVGIISNLLLFAAKLAVGLLSGSIAIVADAVNNLSDCASSIITLVGFKLAGMPADDQHPYGHARFEYISGMIVSFLIMVIGVQFLQSSFDKVRNPAPIEFSPALALVLVLSILVKMWQGLFNRQVGRRIDSGALVATATDSINDVVATSVVLVGAAVGYFTGWHLDGYLGLLVAAFILFSGIGLVRDTLNPLLGMAPDQQLVQQIEQQILSYESVIGLHDLMVHNYGPGHCFASVHVEVPASQDIMVSHDIIDNIERDFALQYNINLVIHLDPIVVDDDKTNRMRDFVQRAAQRIDQQLTVHDFRMVEGKTHTNLIFDVLVPAGFKKSDNHLRGLFDREIRQLEGTYYGVIKVDRNYTSTTN